MAQATTHLLTQSALLVIDAQDSFKAREVWARRNNPKFEENVAALITAYRAHRLPIFYFLHMDEDEQSSPDDVFLKGSPYLKLMDFLQPHANEPVLTKTTRNCFTSTNLQDLLQAAQVRHLVVTGIQMEQCCETTTRVAADLGYSVDFVMDGTMTFPIRSWNDEGPELDVQAIEERTAFVLQRRFARIVWTEQLLAELTNLSEVQNI